MQDSQERFELRVPPEPEAVGAARLFAAGVARHYSIPEEAAEDLRLAISEAVTAGVRANSRSGTSDPVFVAAFPTGRSVEFEIVHAVGPAEPDEDELSLAVIRTLFPGMTVASGDDKRSTMRFAVGLSADATETAP